MDADIDPNYEYDAPQFVDFTAQQVDPDADKWFGKSLNLKKRKVRMTKYRNSYYIFSLSDIKAADEGGAGFESAEDQEENESFEEPKDEATCIVASEITKENNSLEKPLEYAKTVTEAKNDVTLWATWASKASAAPLDNSSSRSQAKRYLTVAYSVAFE